MKYKVGCKVIAELGKGKITKTVGDLYIITWSDGIQYSCDETELEEDYKLKPKKKKNKLKKRVKELEKEKEKVREFTFGISTFLDEQELRIKNIEDRFERFDNSMVEKPKPVLTELEKLTPGSKITVAETPNKKIINPDKKLEERLQELECDIRSLRVLNLDPKTIIVEFCLGAWTQLLCFEAKSDDEIVEKVKQIIEILK